MVHLRINQWKTLWKFTGWWFQPSAKICSSKLIISPNRGENNKYVKPPPRLTWKHPWKLTNVLFRPTINFQGRYSFGYFGGLLFKTKYHVGVSKNRGTPKWMVYDGKPYEQMDDLGGPPLFLEKNNIHPWKINGWFHPWKITHLALKSGTSSDSKASFFWGVPK